MRIIGHPSRWLFCFSSASPRREPGIVSELAKPAEGVYIVLYPSLLIRDIVLLDRYLFWREDQWRIEDTSLWTGVRIGQCLKSRSKTATGRQSERTAGKFQIEGWTISMSSGLVFARCNSVCNLAMLREVHDECSS